MIMKHFLPLKVMFLALAVAACSSQQTRDSDTSTVDGDGPTTDPLVLDLSNPDTWTLDDPASPVYDKLVYFDFDRSEIRSQDRATVLAHGRFLASRQTAQVTLASADATRFGNLQGKVVNISPDAIDSGDGPPFYKIRIAIEGDYFERHGVKYRLVPGVQVMCSIRTGQRSVLAYLTDPFLRSFQTALRER